MFNFLTILLILITNNGSSKMNKNTHIVSSAPKAEKIQHKHVYHDDTRIDDYHWLRDDDRKDPKVIDYLT